MNKRVVLLVAVCIALYTTGNAQQHLPDGKYQWPKDSLVMKKLRQWQQVKFGLLMHWGPYSEWGVVESWSICPEDESWCERKGAYAVNYNNYVAAYERLQTTFNPVLFNPAKWATAAKEAGMKYMVFTTKHHDGFCMFDTDQTDYKVTDEKTPFSNSPKKNITKEIFNAFRADSFMIGAYFSKPDWHSNDYWWRYFPPQTRNTSYNPAKHPEKWNAFKQYTYNQIEELTTDYGKIDILWLDGGWVRPKATIDTSVDWQRAIPYDQDIDMPKIARMSRANQPGVLIVDRTVTGEFENYVTPEQGVPPGYLSYPWESCITLGSSWSYVPDDQFKSTNKVIHILTDVVSRNGNLLLNVAPGPDGDWHAAAYDRLKEIGAWVSINGEAIYGSRGDSIIGQQGNFVFTHKSNAVYAIYRGEEDKTLLPASVSVAHLPAVQVKNIAMLGARQKVKWVQEGDKVVITMPDKLLHKLPCKEAWTFKISY